MPQVTNITVGYDRKRQPAQYESSGARVEFGAVLSATVGDTEDHVSIATKLLGDAKTIVLTELGLVKPGESASAAARAATGEAGPAASTGSTTAAGGRKRTSKPKEGEGTTTAQGASTGSTAGAAGAPDAATRQITQNPEDRRDPANPDLPADDTSGSPKPAAANADLPADEPPAGQGTAAATIVAVPTHNEIHAFIAEQIKSKKLDHATVKGVSGKYKVARIADLKAEQLAPYLAGIKEEIARLAGNSDLTAGL